MVPSNLAWAVLAILSATTVAVAQGFTIDPTKVDPSTRATWCTGEQNTCATLCANNPRANDCDPATLEFHCLCQNNSAPGLDFYLQSMPTFICNEAFKECNDANVGSAAGQRNCTDSIQKKCGTLDPTKVQLGSSPSGTTTQGGGSTNPPSSSTSKAAAPTHLQHFGKGAAAAAVGLFAYML